MVPMDNKHKQQLDPFGWQAFYERYAAPLLARDRFFLGMFVALAVALAEAAALVALVPLHKIEPYVVRVNDLGQVLSSGPVNATGKPPKAAIVYWLGRFVTDLYEVMPGISRTNIEQAFFMTHGAAVSQIEAFLNQHNPVKTLAENPSARVSVSVKKVIPLPHDTAYVSAVVTDELTGRSRGISLTLSYTFNPPKTVADALHNPLGILITNFAEGN